MKLPRRKFLHLAAGAVALLAIARVAWGQAYPARLVRIVVSFPAGSTSDILARPIAQWLQEHLGQPFVIDNRPGAGGNIGTEAVVRAPGLLELTILCATRTNETIGAKWDEIDLAKRLWTIPASRTKRDREHTVPLSEAAVEVLEAMAAIRDDDRVFPISAAAMLLALKELRAEVTVHGFRSTFRSWAGGCTTHPRDVCESALGHATGSAVEQAYQRDALVAKRRVLMADWAAFCGNQPADVVSIEDRRTRIPA
jgi:integrase